MQVKEGDRVKFHSSYGWGGSNPWFYGNVIKDRGKLKIQTNEFEDGPFDINDKYIVDLKKV